MTDGNERYIVGREDLASRGGKPEILTFMKKARLLTEVESDSFIITDSAEELRADPSRWNTFITNLQTAA